MEKYKEIVNDPVKLEASLKDSWAKISKGQESVTLQEFEVASRALAKEMKLPEQKEPTPEEKEAAKKLVDPNGTGKINFEGYKLLVQAGIAKGKREGKI